jgi:hypothetical protein
MRNRWYLVGVDLGQASDPSAIAVLEAIPELGKLRVRHLERVPLGTPYPDVVERVRRITASAASAGRCYVVVDATGSRAVVDLLRRARLQGGLLPVVATSGSKESLADGYHHVPKRRLILGLQTMLARGVVQIAGELPARPELTRELEQMEMRVSRRGHKRYGTWRAGGHDDLVFAVALACWGARVAQVVSGQARRDRAVRGVDMWNQNEITRLSRRDWGFRRLSPN